MEEEGRATAIGHSHCCCPIAIATDHRQGDKKKKKKKRGLSTRITEKKTNSSSKSNSPAAAVEFHPTQYPIFVSQFPIDKIPIVTLKVGDEHETDCD